MKTEERKWVLTVSINDGSPAGGTGMQYFVEEFDGQKFIADSNQEKGLWIDYGKYILKQLPVKEMECLRTNKHEMKNIKMGADEEWMLCDKKEVLELDISYPIEKIHAQTFGIKISTGKYKAPVDFTQEFLTIKLLMDVSQSELFINNGEVVMSNLLFPEDFYKVKLFATGGDLVIEKSIIYEMDEIMNHPLDGELI